MGVSPEELKNPARSIKRLILAAQDIIEAQAAARFLLDRNDIPGDVRRALETAIPVAYARPWKRNTMGKLESHWLPPRGELRALHNEMLKVRDRVSAHTDEEFAARWIEEMRPQFELTTPAFIPAWRPLNPDLLDPLFMELVETQLARLTAGVAELQSRLGGKLG